MMYSCHNGCGAWDTAERTNCPTCGESQSFDCAPAFSDESDIRLVEPAELVYDQMLALQRESVWVPGVANGLLRAMVATLFQLGWNIRPPAQPTVGSTAGVDEIYVRLRTLHDGGQIWAPAMGGDGMRQFLVELLNRGWVIQLPREEPPWWRRGLAWLRHLCHFPSAS